MKKLVYNNSFFYRGSRHFLFFSLTVVLFSFILYSQHNNQYYFSFLRITLINALFFFGFAYITIFLLIPEFLIKRKIIIFILLFTLIGIGLSTLKLIFSETMLYASISPENISEKGYLDLRSIVVNTKDMSFIVAIFCIAKYVKDYLYAEQIRKELEVQKKTAQRKLLGSQFDPHFLFNTINNLYALSLLNPEKTREVIFRIKIILSYIIAESQKEFVKLAQEISLVENYIQLEKLRYGKRLQISLDKEGLIGTNRIPPMILFLLVENCFKHGSSLDAGVPWIKIFIKVEDEKLTLITENSKPKSAMTSSRDYQEGEGFKNLKKRLDILYSPEGYILNIENKSTTFKVELELQTKRNIEIAQSTYR